MGVEVGVMVRGFEAGFFFFLGGGDEPNNSQFFYLFL